MFSFWNSFVQYLAAFCRFSSPSEIDTDQPITFGKNPIFGALTVVLPDIAVDFRGDLLSLTMLDILASQYKVPFSRSTAWEKLLHPSEIAHFTIACGQGHGIDMKEMSLKSALKIKAQASLRRQRDTKARSSLVEVLKDMYAQHVAEEESGRSAADIYVTSTDVLSRDSYSKSWEELNVCRTIIRLALHTAAYGPAGYFRIDLCRKGMTKLETGDFQQNEPELAGPGDEKGNQMAAYSESMPSISGALDAVRLGASDGSGGWHLRNDNERDDFCEDRSSHILFDYDDTSSISPSPSIY